MKSKLLLVILLLITTSCKTNETRINDNIINELAEGDFKIPSIHGFSLLFVSAQDEDKACTNINTLRKSFVTSYTKNTLTLRRFYLMY